MHVINHFNSLLAYLVTCIVFNVSDVYGYAPL